jgi:hypothetical protein
MRHPLKKILVGSLGILLLSSLFFTSVAALTEGEVDVWGSITALFTRVNSQEAKIADLEQKIDDLLDQLDTVKNPPEVIDDPQDPKPEEPDPLDPLPERIVNAQWTEDGLKVTWTAASESTFQGIKIVLSRSHDAPAYPEDGYLTWITDPDMTSKLITPNDTYHGGDVGEHLKPNTEYYLAVTYVFEDEKITTPAVLIKTPSDFSTSNPPLDPSKLTLSVKVVEDRIKLIWTAEPSEDLLGYKVVLSATNPNPSYPDDGYLEWITNRETTTWVIDSDVVVNGGDIDGKLNPNTTYYAAITYLYDDGKVTTEGVSFITPASFEGSEEIAPLDPQLLILNVEIVENVLKLSWTPEPSTALVGVKVVISETNPTPSYPDDGYLTWITDPCVTSWIVDNTTVYYGGDLNGFLMPETTYTFVITYIYADHKVTTLPVTFLTPSDFPITQ